VRILVRLFKTFTRFERLIFLASALIFLTAGVFLTIQLIEKKTVSAPVAGGEYTEGVVGQPSFINPVLAASEVDRDLTKLLFASILDLAESYKTADDGKSWNIRLKENVFWSDGEKITSDDVIFTVKTVQNPDTNSPFFNNWHGIVPERLSEREFRFILPISYAFFESTLRDFSPIPKHIFADVPAANLKLSSYNFEPVGSGKFKFVSAEKRRDGFITRYIFERNDGFAGGQPFLDKFSVKFFANISEAIDAFNFGKISGFGTANAGDLNNIKIGNQTFRLVMPRYYAVFFNPSASRPLQDKNVRLALNYAADKREIIEKVFGGRALGVDGPLLPGLEGFVLPNSSKADFSIERANELLDASDWKRLEGGILKFSLSAPDIPFLKQTAELLKENWTKIGVDAEIKIFSLAEISQEAIKTRNYEMILFGNNLGRSPDLMSFWHSSERFYPGLNLSLYENKDVDALIESVRKDLNEQRRGLKLIEAQRRIVEDAPAVFLYSPDYFYVSQKRLAGFDNGNFIATPSDRFDKVEKWHVKTARIFK
jgi:peptide/nickel transport system substrate-binding protein